VTAPQNNAVADQKVTFSKTISEDVQALALSPDEVPPNITVQVQAVRPDGSRAPLIRLQTRSDWDRRYWFDKPIALPKGSTIEVTASLQDPDLLSNAFGPPSAPASAAKPAFRFALNVIPAAAKPAAPYNRRSQPSPRNSQSDSSCSFCEFC